MSLQVWLPLIYNTKNQGLSTITSSGAPVFKNNGGKLGTKCLDLKTQTTFTCSNLANKKNFTIAFWAKINADSSLSTDWVDLIGFSTKTSAGDNGPQLRWETCYSSTNSGRGISAHNNSGDSIGAGFGNILAAKGSWVHIAVTINYDGDRKCREYVNGIEQRNFVANGGTLTGYFWLGQNNQINGEIQDVRIYDDALSSSEVKRLAQGLVLHYPLNRNGLGTDNLIPNSLTYSGWSINSLWTRSTVNNEIVLSASRTGATSNNWNRIIPPTRFNPTNYPNGITVSFDFKCDNISNLDHKCICALQIYKSNDSRIGWYESKNSFTEANYVGSSTLQNGQWKRLSCYFTQANMKVISDGSSSVSDVSYTTVSFQLVKNGSISIKKIKIENGNHVSSYTPSSQDYPTIEYDCSGYCNNGTKMTDTMTYTSDSAKYQVSTHFNGTYDGILIENLRLSDIINTAVTYAFWIKPEGESGARSIYFGSYSDNSWSIEKTAGNVLRLFWNGSPDETCSGATITDGVWQHICITKSGINDVKVYVNGEQKWNSTAAHNNLNFPTTYRIGRDTRSNDGTPYKGLMSDFRIYATALSADDVKSLYQNK